GVRSPAQRSRRARPQKRHAGVDHGSAISSAHLANRGAARDARRLSFRGKGLTFAVPLAVWLAKMEYRAAARTRRRPRLSHSAHRPKDGPAGAAAELPRWSAPL